MITKFNKNIFDFPKIIQLNFFSSILLFGLYSYFLIFLNFKFLPFLFIFFFAYGLRIYHHALKKLQYTYWSFSIATIIFGLYLFVAFEYQLQIIFLTFFTLKTIELYQVSSPIYFPWFNWWEYDFRYRNDLVATVKFRNKLLDSRITDIRRNAACVKIFERLPIGDKILVIINNGDNNSLTIEGKVVSVRETSLGRGFSYGISFDWSNELTNDYYSQLRKSWHLYKFENKREKNLKKYSSNEKIQ